MVGCLGVTVAAIGEARAFGLCPGAHSPSDFQIGVIIGKGSASFSASLKPCDPQDQFCKSYGHSFVNPGTSVVTYGVADGHFCVEAAPDSKTRRWGWLPTDRVKILPNGGARPLGWWAASWRAPDRRIDIWIDRGDLKSEAGALWRGPLSPRFGDLAEPCGCCRMRPIFERQRSETDGFGPASRCHRQRPLWSLERQLRGLLRASPPGREVKQALHGLVPCEDFRVRVFTYLKFTYT